MSTFLRIAEHLLAHRVLGEVRIRVYEASDLPAFPVLLYGELNRSTRPLVRMQSACVYGDTLGAADCDCYEQLQATFHRFRQDGSGLLFYLPQEGRGAGLADKARAYEYALAQGLNTVEAYQALGLGVDSRSYTTVTGILREDFGIEQVLLLTNNPAKVKALADSGIEVIPTPLRGPVTEGNRSYLHVKQSLLGHDLGLSVGDDSGAPRCITIGAAVMDHVFSTRRSPRLGHATQASKYDRRPGGKGLNQAIAVGRLGGRSTLLSVKGHDDDAGAILNTLAREGVTAAFAPSINGGRTPQTAVIQPYSGAPTYVGWLGEGHRTLQSPTIQRYRELLRTADAILMTLEASAEALRAVVRESSRSTLRILTASPMAEDNYELEAPMLDQMHIIVGSSDELEAIMGKRSSARPEPIGNLEETVCELSRVSNALIIGTDFRRTNRQAVCASSGLSDVVRVHSPLVLLPGGGGQVTPAIGNTDAFAAALAIGILRARERTPDGHGQGLEEMRALLASRVVVTDALSFALQAEAYVAQSHSGGLDSFPFAGDTFDTWCRTHAAQVQP